MNRAVLSVLPVLLAAGLALSVHAQRSFPTVVWFSPSPGSLDMLQLFEDGDAWAAARSRMAVFKFYQQHLLEPPDRIVGPNSYRALVAVDAFRAITRWHKRIAVEVGVVKPQYCTSDDSGMTAAIRDTFSALTAVHQAGADVSFLAMDEPFFSGRLDVCGGPDPGPTLDRLQRYFANLRYAAPAVRVGLIEPYPAFPASALRGFLGSMADRGIPPAFFHLDVDINALRRQDTFAQDVPALADECARLGIPFGAIITGLNGDSDVLYTRDALQLVQRVNNGFPGRLPQLVVQSWAESRTGLRITPTNLPESEPYTHTWLLDETLRILSRPR